jgi:hypothetical protein
MWESGRTIKTSPGRADTTGIVTPTELALAAVNLLKTAHMHRPTILWMSGTHVDRGTIKAVVEGRVERAMSA